MIRVRPCSQLTREHRSKPRAYAHVFHRKNTICIADQFLRIPLNFKVGILLHECGHLVFKKRGQLAADEVIGKVYGIRILRRPYFLATRLEWITPKQLPEATFILEWLLQNGDNPDYELSR